MYSSGSISGSISGPTKVAQFWQYQSDKFGMLSGRIKSAQIMYECGIQEDYGRNYTGNQGTRE